MLSWMFLRWFLIGWCQRKAPYKDLLQPSALSSLTQVQAFRRWKPSWEGSCWRSISLSKPLWPKSSAWQPPWAAGCPWAKRFHFYPTALPYANLNVLYKRFLGIRPHCNSSSYYICSWGCMSCSNQNAFWQYGKVIASLVYVCRAHSCT